MTTFIIGNLYLHRVYPDSYFFSFSSILFKPPNLPCYRSFASSFSSIFHYFFSFFPPISTSSFSHLNLFSLFHKIYHPYSPFQFLAPGKQCDTSTGVSDLFHLRLGLNVHLFPCSPDLNTDSLRELERNNSRVREKQS